MANVKIIGAGFSGLSAAAYLARDGHQVVIYEKNSQPGGRARQYSTQGYTFDMGPSWYWMPDVFERFFADFGYEVSDLYELKLLDPSFEILYDKGQKLSIPASYKKLRELFEQIEPASAGKLDAFMEEARYKYHTAMDNLVYMPGLSLTEFLDKDLLKGLLRLQVMSSFSKHIRRYFSDPKLLALMEFPVLFLGAMPRETPALYSLMNYAGLKLGTWYPMGGMGKIVEAMVKVAEHAGVKIVYNAPVEKILTRGRNVTGVQLQGSQIQADAVVATADYHHVEQQLLDKNRRNYKPAYWEKKVLAPSSLIFYVGLKKKLSKLSHHTLFFQESFLQHSIDIYKKPAWPQKPLFYVCCPSRTDPSVAPEGHENLFFLMPLAPGLSDTHVMREQYFELMLSRLEKHVQQDVRSLIDYKKSYCVSDFINDYNSYKGNAYGLANTLRQTAILKPSVRNRHLDNLFYAGQLTVPGPGVPPSLISGKIAANQITKFLRTNHYEETL